MDSNYKDTAKKLFDNLDNADLTKDEKDAASTNLRRYFNSGDVKWLNEISSLSTKITGLNRAIIDANTKLQDTAVSFLKNSDGKFNNDLDDRQIYRMLGGGDTPEGKWWSNLSDEERAYQRSNWIESTDYIKSLQKELRASGDKYAIEMADVIDNKSKAEAEHYIRESYNNPTVRQMGSQPYQNLMSKLGKDSKVRNIILGPAPKLYLSGNTEKDIDKAFGLTGVLDYNSPNFYNNLSLDQKASIADANSMSVEELDKVITEASEKKAREDEWSTLGSPKGFVTGILAPRVQSKKLQGLEVEPQDVALDIGENVLYTLSPATAMLNKAGKVGKAVKTLAQGQGIGGKVTKGGVYLADQSFNPIAMEVADAALSNDPMRNGFGVADVLQGTLTNIGMDRMLNRGLRMAGANRDIKTIPQAISEAENTAKNIRRGTHPDSELAPNFYNDTQGFGQTDPRIGMNTKEIKEYDEALSKKGIAKNPKIMSAVKELEKEGISASGGNAYRDWMPNFTKEILELRQKYPNKNFTKIDDVYPYLSKESKEYILDNPDFVNGVISGTIYGNPFEPRPANFFDKPKVNLALQGTSNFASNKFGDAHPEMASRIPMVGQYVTPIMKSIRNDETDDEKKARELQERWSVIFNN